MPDFESMSLVQMQEELSQITHGFAEDIAPSSPELTTESDASRGEQDKPRKPKRRRRMLTGVSKQRRAANARERRRIQGVNMAFVELRQNLPVLSKVEVSKIEILRLASKWIAHLTTVLLQDDERRGWDSCSEDGSGSSDGDGEAASLQPKSTLKPEIRENLDDIYTIRDDDTDNFVICRTGEEDELEHAQGLSMTSSFSPALPLSTVTC
ncbi:uncharacterized protein LOC144860267 [Branchiostoma floridae x Branchiostoma japonicum]